MENDFLNRRNRVVIFALLAILLPLIVVGADRAIRSNSNRVADWLPESFEGTKRLRWFLKHFQGDELLMVSWPGCTLDDDRLPRLAEALVEPPPGQTEPLFRRVFTGPEVLASLTAEPLEISPEDAKNRMEGWLLGPDRRTTCAVALVSEAGRSNRHGAVAWVYRCAQKASGLSPQDIHVAGPTVDGVAIDQISTNSLLRLNLVCYILCFLIMFACLRNMKVAVMVLLTALLCEGVALATVYYTGGQMDSMLLMMASLAYVLSVSAAMHMVNYYRDALGHVSPEQAPAVAFRRAWTPCLLAAATTALGLGSLCISKLTPIVKFGAYSAWAVLASFAILFVLLPTLLRQWPAQKWFVAPDDPSRHHRRSHWKWLMALVTRYHVAIVVLTIAAMAVAGHEVLRIRTTAALHDLFDRRTPVIRDYDWLEKHIGPLVPVEVVVRFPRQNESTTFERMLVVERIRAAIEQLDDVGTTISAATFGPKLPRTDWVGFGSAARRAVLQRRLQHARQSFIDTQYVHDTPDEVLWRISVRVAAGHKVDFGAFMEDLDRVVQPVLAEAADQHPGSTVLFAGGIPVVQEAQAQLLRDLISSFLLAFGLIAVTMVILLRSVSAGLIVMIPNLLPTLLVFGAMGWSDFEVDIGSMMTASAALGIAVDGTLHFVTAFRRGQLRGYARRQAVLFAYMRCGAAMTATTLVCSFGLLVFSISMFTPTARFAYLMFTLLFVALLGDLVVLPAILISPLGRVFRPRAAK